MRVAATARGMPNPGARSGSAIPGSPLPSRTSSASFTPPKSRGESEPGFVVGEPVRYADLLGVTVAAVNRVHGAELGLFKRDVGFEYVLAVPGMNPRPGIAECELR